ncbi:alpha-2-HS-glycoprotein 1 [Paramormyrops kingsleyae]|uniref:alpha-2-HS-glycoprotein 1 n=1 Tax=Paramormyrops kingsleyae TaxID=1676925 RepID=UPI000CD64020|nr:antihemorrhagic factor cHLP-B-like [Paramormyrops kingsleyae]
MLTLAGLFLLAHVFLAAGVLPAERPSIPCDENGAVPASQAAFQHISAQHHHGYKYKLRKSASSQLLKKDDLACEFHLELDLEETTCHVVNPKPVEECVVRETHETKVQSNCNVTLTVVEGKPTVKKYSCSSDPASAEELQKICPDCPSLLPLHYPAGLDSIKSALKKFHEESNETSNFKLLEVGRLSTQHMLTGQSYLAEFAIVQTDCRSHVICVLGRGKAQYGFCKSTVLGNDEVSVDCEIYDAQNLTDGRHHHHHRHHRPHHHHHHPGGKHNGHHSHNSSHEHPHYRRPGGRHNGHSSQEDSHEHPRRSRPGWKHNSHPSHNSSHEHPHYRRPGGRHNGHSSHEDSHEHPRRSRPGWKHNSHPSRNSSHEHPHRPHNLPPFFSGSSEHPHPDTELHHCRGQVKIPPSIHPICPHPIRHMPPTPADN